MEEEFCAAAISKLTFLLSIVDVWGGGVGGFSECYNTKDSKRVVRTKTKNMKEMKGKSLNCWVWLGFFLMSAASAVCLYVQ